MNKYITERTGGFCSGTQILQIFTDVSLFTSSPPVASTSLATFSFCMTTQEPSVSLAGLASVSLLLQLQQAYPSSACEFTGLILHSTCRGFPKRYHWQSWLLPSLCTKADASLNPCMSLKDWYCPDLILKEEASHGSTCNITQCWKKIPLVSLLIHSQLLDFFFSQIHPNTLKSTTVCRPFFFFFPQKLSWIMIIIFAGHPLQSKEKNCKYYSIIFGIHWHVWWVHILHMCYSSFRQLQGISQ